MTPEIIEMLRLALNSAAGQAKDLARKGCKNSQRFLSEIADAYAALDGWAAKSEEAVARSKDPRWQVLSIPNPHIPTTTLTWAVCRGVAPMLTRDDRERAEGIADALNGLRSDRVLNAEDYEAVEELADRFDSTLAAHVHPLAAPPDEAREASVVTRCYIATEGGSPYANIEDAILHGRLRRIEGCRIVIGEDGTVSISGRHREGMDAEPPAPPTEEPHDLSCAKPNHLYLLKPRRQPSGLPVDRHFDSPQRDS